MQALLSSGPYDPTPAGDVRAATQSMRLSCDDLQSAQVIADDVFHACLGEAVRDVRPGVRERTAFERAKQAVIKSFIGGRRKRPSVHRTHESSHMSEYELKRQDTIAANQAVLAKMWTDPSI